MIRRYSELRLFPTFQERFEYLRLDGRVGAETFGFDRYINQRFYMSREWKRVRDLVIVRDNGFDLGVQDFPLQGKPLIHHMNPISVNDITDFTEFLLNPEYLICTCQITHNALHYGNEPPRQEFPVERRKNDTCPWKK